MPILSHDLIMFPDSFRFNPMKSQFSHGFPDFPRVSPQQNLHRKSRVAPYIFHLTMHLGHSSAQHLVLLLAQGPEKNVARVVRMVK